MIPFTEFVRPLGRRKEILLPCSKEAEALAKELLKAGFRFEAELLTTREISLTVSTIEKDYDIEVFWPKQGAGLEQITEAVSALITRAHEKFKAGTLV